MGEKKANGVSVIDVPVGETFVAKDGQRYKAVLDLHVGYPCACCAFVHTVGLCWRYPCLSKDREDGKSVHFVKC